MALTKVTGFTGEAELLGALRAVSFDGESLRIGGLSLDEGYGILDALSTGQLVAVRVRAGTQPQPPPVREEQLATKEQTRSMKRPEPQAEKPAETKPSAKEKPAEPAVKEAKPAKGFEPVVVPPPKEEPKEDPALEFPPKEDAPATGALELPSEIAASKRVFPVMDYVIKKLGLKRTDVAGITAALEAVKEQVPVLKKVRDMKDKVEANIATYQEAGDAA